jgi:hypothetical protein
VISSLLLFEHQVDNAEYAFNRIPVALALKVLRFGNDLEFQQKETKMSETGKTPQAIFTSWRMTIPFWKS